MPAGSRSLALLALASVARCSVRLSCETTVSVQGGALEIELWPKTAPRGVERLVELVEGGFFTDLPFYSVLDTPGVAHVMFGIQPSASKQRAFDDKGAIPDDPRPCAGTVAAAYEGLLAFSGDSGKVANSRSTLLYMTLGSTRVEWHRRRPWDVPVGRVKKGLEVVRGIFAGYGSEPVLGRLDPTKDAARAAAYLAQFPKLDRFKRCSVVRDEAPDTDPGQHCPKDEV